MHSATLMQVLRTMPSFADRRRQRLGAAIAAAFLDGEWEPNEMAARAGTDLGLDADDPCEWLRQLALVAVHGFTTAPLDRPREFRAFVQQCDAFVSTCAVDAHVDPPRRRHDDDLTEPFERLDWLTLRPHRHGVSTRMGTARWPVRPLDTMADLQDMLGLSPTQLAWFADVRSLERSAQSEPLRHYHYRWIPKASGGSRLLEAPKGTLKFFQRRILSDIVAPIPPHAASHGFRPGRSVHSFVAPHVGSETVIRIDLESFFTSISAGGVFGMLRSAGYPEPVAHCLAGLVTNATPPAVCHAASLPPIELRSRHRRMMSTLRQPHLPQGAPTSPALANLAAYGLDCRLTGLAKAFSAVYTRYADDLAFSGGAELTRRSERFVRLASEIITSEGFSVNRHKTRVATQARRQILTGLVVNDSPNIPRTDFDRLKAVLHDAALHGPIAANRQGHDDFRAHLLGMISWVAMANPQRAARLQQIFDTITW